MAITLATQQVQQENLASASQASIQRNADRTGNLDSASAAIGACMKVLSL